MMTLPTIRINNTGKPAFNAEDRVPDDERVVGLIELEEILLEGGLISRQELRWAHSVQQVTGEPLVEILVRLHYLDENALNRALESIYEDQGSRAKARSPRPQTYVPYPKPNTKPEAA